MATPREVSIDATSEQNNPERSEDEGCFHSSVNWFKASAHQLVSLVPVCSFFMLFIDLIGRH